MIICPNCQHEFSRHKPNKYIRKLSIEAIVQRRSEGKTITEIAEEAGVSKSWVGKILKQEGVTPEKAEPKRVDKRQLIAAKVWPEVKDAAHVAASTLGLSLSEFVVQSVRDTLKDMQIEIVKPVNNDPALPWDDETTETTTNGDIDA